MPVHNTQNITIRKVTFQTFHTIKDECYDTNVHMKPKKFFLQFFHT